MTDEKNTPPPSPLPALKALVDIVVAETGALTMNDPDDDSVGWSESGPLPMTFGHVRRAMAELASYSPSPLSQMVGTELPSDIVEHLLAIGTADWGQTFCQSDEKHVEDFARSLRITREGAGIEAEETTIHYVCLEGTGTILALAGNSPNSPQTARILAGAWNQLIELAKAQSAASALETDQ